MVSSPQNSNGTPITLQYAWWFRKNVVKGYIDIDSMNLHLIDAEDLCLDAIKKEYGGLVIALTHKAFWLTKTDETSQKVAKEMIEKLMKGDEDPEEHGALDNGDFDDLATLKDFVLKSNDLQKKEDSLPNRHHLVFIPYGTVFCTLFRVYMS